MRGDEDKGYVLTAIAHPATVASQADGSVFGFHWETTAGAGDVQKGGWITDISYGTAALPAQSTVATETLTIAHEGFFLT
jgi:hypothetical protein